MNYERKSSGLTDREYRAHRARSRLIWTETLVMIGYVVAIVAAGVLTYNGILGRAFGDIVTIFAAVDNAMHY